jgi:hypothetical protein
LARPFSGFIRPITFRLSFFLLFAALLGLVAIIYSSFLNIRKSRQRESRTNSRGGGFRASGRGKYRESKTTEAMMPILFHPLIFIYTSRVQKLTRSLRFSLRLLLGVLVVAFAADRGVLDRYMSGYPTLQKLGS